MIFVSIGTNETPFDRLLQAVERFDTRERVVVQNGSSAIRPANGTSVDFLGFEEFRSLVREANVFVTHAGAGSVLIALQEGKRPVVLPRLRRFGEAVDDHQLAFARRLHALGLVTLVEDERQLAEAVAAASEAPSAGAFGPTPNLAGDLRDYLRSQIDYSR